MLASVQHCFTILLHWIVHAWDTLTTCLVILLSSLSLFLDFSFMFSCSEQIFISCVVSRFHEADCCHGDDSPQMEARERGVQQRVFTGSDTKLVDTHTWYSCYDENLCAYRCSRAQTHTHTRTWLRTDLLSLSKLGQFFYVINFTPWNDLQLVHVIHFHDVLLLMYFISVGIFMLCVWHSRVNWWKRENKWKKQRFLFICRASFQTQHFSVGFIFMKVSLCIGTSLKGT